MAEIAHLGIMQTKAHADLPKMYTSQSGLYSLLTLVVATRLVTVYLSFFLGSPNTLLVCLF